MTAAAITVAGIVALAAPSGGPFHERQRTRREPEGIGDGALGQPGPGNVFRIFNAWLCVTLHIGDLENYLFQSECMKRLFKLRPGNKFIVIGGTAGMRELAEKDPEKVNTVFPHVVSVEIILF